MRDDYIIYKEKIMTLSTNDIFLPVIALLLWTMVFGAFMGIYRFRAVKEGKVHPRIVRKSGLIACLK